MDKTTQKLLAILYKRRSVNSDWGLCIEPSANQKLLFRAALELQKQGVVRIVPAFRGVFTVYLV